MAWTATKDTEMHTNLFLNADIVPKDDMSSFFDEFRFEIYGFGGWRRNKTDTIEDFIVSKYELSYLEKGRLEIKTSDAVFLCEEGSIFIFEPFTLYTVRKLYDQDMEIYNIFFDIFPEHRQIEFFGMLAPDGNIVWKNHELPKVGAWIHLNIKSCRSSPDGEMILVEALLKSLLVFMMRAQRRQDKITFPAKPAGLSRKNQIVKKAIEYIHKNIENPIRISSLCGHLCTSESYLYKSFIDITNDSPQKYILKCRIKKAEQLMRHYDYSVEQAAAALGFSSGYHLSSVFKKILGKAPTHYVGQNRSRRG